MKPSDRELGMGRRISRRDLLHGFGALAASTLLSGRVAAGETLPPVQVGGTNSAYPPARTGWRGNHVGSFEAAHELAHRGRREWGVVREPETEAYDLVVVGGGISGLAAAHFHRKRHPDARILILDNHDDFGGHAKRNEFQVGGRTLIGYGGSQTLSEPSGYSEVVKGLLRDLGVDRKRFDTAFHHELFKKNGLRSGIYFNRESWGVDRLVPYGLGIIEDYVPLAGSDLTTKQAVSQMPIAPLAQREFLRLLVTEDDHMSEIPADAKMRYLATISYRDFLLKHLKIRESDVFKVLQDLRGDSGVGIEAVSAWSCLSSGGLPGRKAAGLPPPEPYERYIHHFPDGNASIARLLVREMIPGAAAGSSMDDVVTARFDYSKLDQESSAVRLRLDSTVIRAQHEGDPKTAKRVLVTYVRGGHAYRVKARSCVLACYHAAIPHLCPELPGAQQEALALQVKIPILYSTVALRDWKAWKKLRIGGVVAPGSYHTIAMLDFPVSLGGYAYAKNPDEPILVHMERFPHRNNEGLAPNEQHRLARREMLSEPFEGIERKIRGQLSGLLGPGGFDPARDIAGISVNRWAHGYANFGNSLFSPTYADDDDERYPHMQARKRFGRIAIANSDAAATPMLEAAVEQGYRAVNELA